MKPFLIKFYANGADFLTLGVTQNNLGWYYWNGVSYYKPILAKFDTARLPLGYKKYTTGSHSKPEQRRQNPYDFSLLGGTVITCNLPVKILRRIEDGDASALEILVDNKVKVLLVHTSDWSTSTDIPAGSGICQVRKMNGSHIHLGSYEVNIKDFLLYKKIDLCEECQKELVRLTKENIELKAKVDALTKDLEKCNLKISEIDKIIHA